MDLLYFTGLAHDVLEDTAADPEVLKQFDLDVYFDVDCLTLNSDTDIFYLPL